VAEKHSDQQTRLVNTKINHAMANLALPECSSIRDVFGRVLDKRSKQQNPECALFTILAMKQYPLQQLNEDCGIFVNAIGLADTQRKCRDALMGKATGPAGEFNGSTDDFWSEMAAVRTLINRGFDRIRAIHKQQLDGTTSDYEAYLGDTAAHIEVKNVRSNPTVLNVFDGEINKQFASEPAQYGFHLAIRYAYDNRPTAEQDRKIREYVKSLRGRVPPFQDALDLTEATAQISVTKGPGTSMMIRGLRPDSPESFSKERFLAKMREVAGNALSQMKDENRLRVAVINFNSPSGSISEEYLHEAEELIVNDFGGAIQPIILFYRQLPSAES
jgi:hypothetical protein